MQNDKKVQSANLRILATIQRASAAAYRRQAQHPIYPGQDIFCAGKACQLEAFAARSEAQANSLEN